jgi:2-methylcitrate dehydratase PrpD
MIVRLAEKVKLEVDQDMEMYFPERALSRVTVTTIKGDSFNAFEETTLGDWNNPLSDKQMEDKFRIYAGQILSDHRLEQIMEMVQSLETLESVDDLLQVG